ncbi:MAG: 3-hydroxyacyl-ACP dehydratase [Syntrophus sp. (in: bacteria)]|nr:3-hydroxyacyl-ACP dehydratase [Syntrophus sp. (in: bacteria)]
MTIYRELPMDADKLVPQRSPMRAIDRLISYDGQCGVAEAIIATDSIFIRDDGCVEPIVFVELIAQSFAAIKGYDDLIGEQKVDKGFLVEVKGFRFFGAAHGGDLLQVVVNKLGGTAEFALAEGKVICGEEVIASGKAMVWVPQGV